MSSELCHSAAITWQCSADQVLCTVLSVAADVSTNQSIQSITNIWNTPSNMAL